MADLAKELEETKAEVNRLKASLASLEEKARAYKEQADDLKARASLWECLVRSHEKRADDAEEDRSQLERELSDFQANGVRTDHDNRCRGLVEDENYDDDEEVNRGGY